MRTKQKQEPKPRPSRPIPAWLDLLLAEDDRTQGNPSLPLSSRLTIEEAVDTLNTLLVDFLLLNQYVNRVAMHYQSRKKPRRVTKESREERERREIKELVGAFRHKQLLPSRLVWKIAEHGTGVFLKEESHRLPTLLLNPFALWDLADCVMEVGKHYSENHLGRLPTVC